MEPLGISQKPIVKIIKTNALYASRVTIAYCLLALALFPFQTVKAQNTIQKPKIGVVLSGGGAKGFAHIGVLKVIDSLGIKVDYIGGTSMGSVVGGLYASGYTAKQIDSLFHEINFTELLQDYIPRKSKSFYEKRNDEVYAITLPFKKFNLGLPLALSKGMYNYNLLTRLLHPVHHTTNFKELPIPFVCVATDIEKGKEIVLDKGCLPQAILASSAFPSLFSPVEIDGKMLIDGGVLNNYPVELVKQMGADIIIGVDVQDNLKDRNELKDATRILVQISNLQMIESMKNKIKQTDIYIKPDISAYNVVSFDDGAKIIQAGELAALQHIQQLNIYSNINYKKTPLKKESDSIWINKVSINELRNYTRAYVMGKLGFKTKNKISYTQLVDGINKLNATQNFRSIYYQLNDNNNNDELSITLQESKIRTFLKFGLHYDGLYKSGILTNITQKRSLFRNDVISLDVILGDNFRYNLDYYIDNGFYFSFGVKSRFNQFNRNVATDFNNGSTFSQLGINTLNIDFQDFTNQTYVQTIFAQKFLIGAGLEWKHIKLKSNTLQSSALFENSDYGSVFGYLKYDSFDNKYFPKKGWYLNGDLQSYLYSTNYTEKFNRFSIAKAETGVTRTFFKKINLKFQTEAGLAFGESSVHFMDFILGGYGFMPINNFKHFYGYDFVSIAADSYIKTALTFDFEFYKKKHINFSANFANAENGLFQTGNWLSIPKYSGYAFGYGLETFIGPVEIKYSWSPELPKGYTWFGVGFWF
ncbi:patatin-like phospholipase family protein [Flavobacterium croceum]|uniref:patatin-like phospholipase family protein n=1 Tax=Flavobacterium croceum TaxID=370975 RepID=UPI0024A94269|nr:patatin-like phospholipase family protein [Flavobacterium croceum]